MFDRGPGVSFQAGLNFPDLLSLFLLLLQLDGGGRTILDGESLGRVETVPKGTDNPTLPGESPLDSLVRGPE